MSTSSEFDQPWFPQRLHVPRENRGFCCIPALDRVPDLLQQNRIALNGSVTNIQGRTLGHLRSWTRQVVLPAALDYTNEINPKSVRSADSSSHSQNLEEQPIVVSGHQPSMFHPGVWVKNFVLDNVARRVAGTGLSLVVDNDTVSATSIRVPTGSRTHPTITSFDFDSTRPTEPWEEATVLDEQLFRSFADRVSQAMSAWGVEPMLNDVWPDAIAMLERSRRLSDCLTAARCNVEHRWGLTNHELPMSRLCQLDPFLWFASHLFAHAPRMRDIHNRVLDQYRRVNRVRSRTHPVPELAAQDGWTESPFWVWRSHDRNRRHVFVKSIGREIHLSDRKDVFARLPLTQEMDACCAVEVLRELASQGIHLRTRALTTTLFTRLCLGDIFIHGIGGAKYDEMTDRIIGEFFAVTPPTFLIVSATLNIPLAETHRVSNNDAIQLRNRLRKSKFNPEQFLQPKQSDAVQALADEKTLLISKQNEHDRTRRTRHERRDMRRENQQRYQQFHQLNDRLANHAYQQREDLQRELLTVEEQLASNRLLQDREFSYGLFPSEYIREFMLDSVNVSEWTTIS